MSITETTLHNAWLSQQNSELESRVKKLEGEISRLKADLAKQCSYTESWKELADGHHLVVDWAGDSLRLLLGDASPDFDVRWDALVKQQQEIERLKAELKDTLASLDRAVSDRDH